MARHRHTFVRRWLAERYELKKKQREKLDMATCIQALLCRSEEARRLLLGCSK